MDMGSERWTLLYDPDCTAWVRDVRFDFRNDILPPSTMKLSMDIQATVRRRVQQPSIWSEEQNNAILELDHKFNPVRHQNQDPYDLIATAYDMSVALSHKLSQLQVPVEAHQLIIGTILSQASQAAREYAAVPIFPDGATMSSVLYMAVVVSVCVAKPAVFSFMEKLERARVEEDSTMCSICLEEMVVGSEATRMPCSHLYHPGCIVEWLRKTRNCPLCRFSLPRDHEDETYYEMDYEMAEWSNYDLSTPSGMEEIDELPNYDLNIPLPTHEMDELTLLTEMNRMAEWLICLIRI